MVELVTQVEGDRAVVVQRDAEDLAVGAGLEAGSATHVDVADDLVADGAEQDQLAVRTDVATGDVQHLTADAHIQDDSHGLVGACGRRIDQRVDLRGRKRDLVGFRTLRPACRPSCR